MNKTTHLSLKSLNKKKLREKKIKDLAFKLKQNIKKRKQSKLRTKNG